WQRAMHEPGAPRIVGVHLEGPYLNRQFKGAHPLRHLRAPDARHAAALLDAVSDTVRLVTLAPELPGAAAVIRALRERGCVVAAGHTAATYEQAHAAFGAGVTLVTHLFNAMRPVHHRDPGIVVAALEHPQVTVSLIADFIHVHPAVVTLAVRLRPGQLMLNEIHERPLVLERVWREEGGAVRALARRLRAQRPRAVVLAARGTSDNAALYGRYLIETHLRIPASLAAPSVVTLYGVRVKLRGMVVIGLSQSGRSPDIVRVIESARDAGATTVAITNDPRAPLARAADEVLVLHAGAERSVAATKTYTAQLMLLSLLVAHTAGNSRLIRAHEALPEAVARALQTAPAVADAAALLQRARECLVTSR